MNSYFRFCTVLCFAIPHAYSGEVPCSAELPGSCTGAGGNSLLQHRQARTAAAFAQDPDNEETTTDNGAADLDNNMPSDNEGDPGNEADPDEEVSPDNDVDPDAEGEETNLDDEMDEEMDEMAGDVNEDEGDEAAMDVDIDEADGAEGAEGSADMDQEDAAAGDEGKGTEDNDGDDGEEDPDCTTFSTEKDCSTNGCSWTTAFEGEEKEDGSGPLKGAVCADDEEVQEELHDHITVEKSVNESMKELIQTHVQQSDATQAMTRGCGRRRTHRRRQWSCPYARRRRAPPAPMLKFTQAGIIDESMTGKGEDYRGVQTKTRSGRTCQWWTAQTPHKHWNTPANKAGKGVGDHNYCRNPDGEPSMWCYTQDKSKRWEYCDALSATEVQVCPFGYKEWTTGSKCTGGGKCCKAGWTSRCDQSCAQRRCATAKGTWIALDYSTNPYTCEIPKVAGADSATDSGTDSKTSTPSAPSPPAKSGKAPAALGVGTASFDDDLFNAVDTNNNGQISRSEVKAAIDTFKKAVQ